MSLKKNNRLPLTAKEYRQTIINWNKTEKFFPENITIQELFEEQVKKTPHNIALTFNGHKITYRTLH